MDCDVASLASAANGGSKTYLQMIGQVAANDCTKPFLGLASGHCRYWCKRVDSAHEPQAVVNEVAASVVGECLNAHVRPWKIIYVPDSLVGDLVGSGETRYRLTDKPLFGSRDLPTGKLYQDFQTTPFADKDDNYAHIPKLIALWLLCNVQEDLQILSDADDDHSLWSIDHGLWFDSGPRPWQLASLDKPGGKPRIPPIQAPMASLGWDKAIAALDGLGPSLAAAIHDSLPQEWAIPRKDTLALAKYVLDRKEHTRCTLETLKSNIRINESMRFNYWTIRVVPEPMGITSIGVGVIVMDPDSGAAQIRMREDRKQFAGFQYEQAIDRLLRQFKSEVQDFVSAQTALGFDEKLTLAGYLGFLSDHWMNLVRVDKPKAMDAADLESAADLLFSSLIGGPTSTSKSTGVSQIRQAVRSSYRTFPWLRRAVHDNVQASVAQRGLDLNLAVIGRSGVVELNQAFNLRSSKPDKTRGAIENWTLKVEKLREEGGLLEVRGETRELSDDVHVAAVVSRPSSNRQRQNIQRFQGFCKELTIDLVYSDEVESHAERLNSLIVAA